MLKLINQKLFSTLKVPIQAIKKLRQQTSAPIGQCKTALEETGCDHKAAMAWLKQKGLVQAQKRLDKETRQGVIGAMVTGCRAKCALVQVNSQTDFVAKNQLVLNFAYNVMARAIQNQNILNLEKEPENKAGLDNFLVSSASNQLFPGQKDITTLSQELKIMISRLQQNIKVRRVITLHSDQRRYGVYVHQGYNQYVGLQAAVTQFHIQPEIDEQNQDQISTFSEFADNIATQMLGSPPKYLRMDEIPSQQIAVQTEKVKQQMKQRLQKAPAHTHEKIISGKLNSSFYQEILLPKMSYVLSNSGIPVEQYWNEVQKQLNRKITITNAYVWSCK